MAERRPSSALFVVYATAIAFGAAIIYWQASVLHQQRASFQWPTVTGTIVQSERLYVPGRHSHYRADVTYRYAVNGTPYVSHQISLWSQDLSSYDSISEAFVANHRAGTSVDVYYEPGQPRNAVLIPGPDEKFNKAMMAMGGIAMIAAVIGMFRRIPRQRRLAALLNAPDAATRTIRLRRLDIESGTRAFVGNVGIAFLFVIVAMGLLLGPLEKGPTVLLEATRRTNPWLPIAGVGCVLGAGLFFVRAVRKGRGAACPLCGDFLNKRVFLTGECPGCKTRIVFEGEAVHEPTAVNTQGSDTKAACALNPHPPHSKTLTRSREHLGTSRLLDVAGFMAFPIVFLWLWAGADKRLESGMPVVFTIGFLVLGACYCFFPETLGGKSRRSSRKVSHAADGQNPGPYLLDFSIILSAPVGLFGYLVYFIWQHQQLRTAELIGVIVGFPAAVGTVTYVCKVRFTRATALKVPIPPAFVPMTLLALWLVGTFIWVVFVVCLVFKLIG